MMREEQIQIQNFSPTNIASDKGTNMAALSQAGSGGIIRKKKVNITL
jgi:hypothetical protein